MDFNCDNFNSDIDLELKDIPVTLNAESLSTEVWPTEYEITINPNIKEKNYTGDVAIHFTVGAPIITVIINCLDIEIEDVWITFDSQEQNNIQIENTFMDKKNEIFIIYPGQKLRPDNYVLYITFKNSLSEENVGLYVDSYKDSEGETQQFIMTHFQPNYARRVFPCFDDPIFQAKFQINIVRPSEDDVVALSNMGVEKETASFPEEELTTVHFLKSPPIPTHKVVIATGKFSFIPSIPTAAGLYVSVYIRKDLVERTEYFINMALAVTETAERLFYLRLSLQKIVILGIPRSLLISMEHVGLVTIEDKYLQMSKSYTMWQYLKSLTIISLEIGHVWISNFASLKYWNDYWLKEGLAGYLGYILASLYQKDCYTSWVALAQNTFPIMILDGFKNSKTVVEDSFKSVTMHNIYKNVIFKKTISLMFMIFYGRLRQFKTILYKYFSTEKILTTTVFYNIARELLPFDPEPIFNTFLHQTGYPVLEVNSLYGVKHVVQRKSFVNNKYYPKKASTSVYGYTWEVPIYYICENHPEDIKFQLLPKDQTKVDIVCGSGQWILINYKHLGYYRVNYSKEKWTTFAFVLMRTPEVFDAENKAGLIEDAFCLTKAGYFHYNIPFNLTVYLHFYKEIHCLPWHIVNKNLHEVFYHLIGTPAALPFMLYVRSLLQGSYTDSFWKEENLENESAMEKLTKSEILNMGGWSGDPRILQQAKEMFNKWFDLGEVFEPNLLQIILKYGLHNEKNSYLWERVLRRFQREHKEETKDDCWTVLGFINVPTLIEKLLQSEPIEYFLQPEIFQKRLKPLLQNNFAIEPLWNFLRNNSDLFLSQKMVMRQAFRSLLNKVASKFDNCKKLKEVMLYFKTLNVNLSMKRVIETIENNVNWKAAYYDVLSEWLHLYVTSISDEETLEEMEEE